jgi:hypothetical protein
MYSILGFFSALTRRLTAASQAQPVGGNRQQSTVGALMEKAEACAVSDLHQAQELRRAAIVLLGVSR